MAMARAQTTKNDHQTPLGKYLMEARESVGASRREIARRSGVSESRIRQVELGYQQINADLQVPVSPKPETAAAIARAVGADVAKALELAGFDPKWHEALVKGSTDTGGRAQELYDWFTSLGRAEREEVLGQLQRLHVDAELSQQAG